jgi:hypothetical protein
MAAGGRGMTDRNMEEVKTIMNNMDELKKQLRWLIHKGGEPKLNEWLETHPYMRGAARRMKEEKK